jgi:SapC
LEEPLSDAKTRTNGASPAPESALPVFYRQPRPLNAVTDAKNGLNAANSYAFARSTNSLVVNAVEFPFAMRAYPIVFTTSEPRAAVAVLGLADGENLFIGDDGAWAENCYIPAYARRYPFILMEQPGSSDMLLCLDTASGLIVEGGARPLFEDGKPSKLVQDALAFCREFHAQHLATMEFVKGLASHGLLTPNEARVTLNSGRQMTLRGFDVIDEAKFNALPDEVFLDWRRRGWLHLVYCHLMAMANWSRLVDLSAKRAPAA